MEWKYSRHDLADGTATIASVPCLVKGVYVNEAMNANALEIKDSTSKAFTVPASASAGNSYDFSGDGVRYETSLIVVPDAGGTGEVTIVYVKLEEAHA